MHMSIRGVFILSVLIWAIMPARGQQTKGTVDFVQDSLITILQQARIQYAQQLREVSVDDTEVHKTGTKTTALGFRIQIYTGSSREAAYDAQARFKNIYPEIPTYISYTQPNYRVKVGDFRSRNQANALMAELKKRFSPVFLFTEEVNVYY